MGVVFLLHRLEGVSRDGGANQGDPCKVDEGGE